ncbi:cation diffusion facilitator family transporter [Amycolatopsis thermophila]|uniref:Divalent metal cation (Fe/Co/Zn/Cd) transporter n=1 Tax=Amycolatopsis thermophila TaxID=206084 RepID=A0ABU0F1X0_9PSEU|nr:divalent metal cation (Fe/Co/Zn/Cd) transporter [Amycolatopsis thermophila]
MWSPPHSHDSADRFDSALETSKRGMRTLVWSFLALFVTAIAQLVIVLFTGSVALLGDTIHNFADALTALPVGIAFALGRRAASRRFTYGLGRAEDLAGVVVVVIIALSAALAGYEAVERLIDPQPVTGLWVVAAAGVIGFLGNELVARWRITVGGQIGSAALVADGLHARADGFTSLAVVLGGGLGFPYPHRGRSAPARARGRAPARPRRSASDGRRGAHRAVAGADAAHELLAHH